MSDAKKAWIDLPLDELLDGGVLLDVSGHRRHAKAEGGLEVVDDELFGRCLLNPMSTGRELQVSLPPLRAEDFPAGATIVAWARSSFRVYFGPKAASCTVNGQSAVVNYGFQTEGYGGEVAFFTSQPQPGWFLFAAVIPPSGPPRVLAPPIAFGDPGKGTRFPLVDPTASPDLVMLPSHRLARFRLFPRELDAAEVEAIRREDLAGLIGARGAPVSLSLEGEGGESILYVDPAARERPMTLKVSADTGLPLRLVAPQGEVGPARWHLRLSFRPGTLDRLDAVKVAGDGWKLATARDEGQDTLYLLSATARALPFSVALTGLVPDDRQGTRVTRVELGYQGVWMDQGAELRDTRTQQLSVLLHAGPRAWTPLVLANGWTAGIVEPACSRDAPGGVVRLRGHCRLQVSPQHRWRGEMLRPFELPAGFRPSSICTFPARAWIRRPGAQAPPIAPSHVVLNAQWVALYFNSPPMGGVPDPSVESDPGWEAVLYLDGISYGGEP